MRNGKSHCLEDGTSVKCPKIWCRVLSKAFEIIQRVSQIKMFKTSRDGKYYAFYLFAMGRREEMSAQAT